MFYYYNDLNVISVAHDIIIQFYLMDILRPLRWAALKSQVACA